MMYKSNFVASLKVGGKILRENSGVVSLPFGSEYSVLLKNLHSRRAMVKVSVDGQDATEGTKLILPANGSIELERFIRNGNLEEGNRFKFIERTEQIENHRGIKEDDGLVRVEFWTEKEVVDIPIVRHHYYNDWYPNPYHPPRPYWVRGLHSRSIKAAASAGSNIIRGQGFGLPQSDFNESGITVPGSRSEQKFQNSFGFDLESNSHVVVLQLRGKVGEVPVATPVTVDRKLTCATCGKTNKQQDKFCRECGTSLQLI